jgi:hypothetical protein
MDNIGFIRERLDLKLLILYVLERLTRPVTVVGLSDLVLCDGAINYFDFVDALSSLVDTGHVAALDGSRYMITTKGSRNLAEFVNRLPYTIRLKAGNAAERMARVLEREALIKVGREEREDGSCTVHLDLSDDKGPILHLDLLAGTDKQAERMEQSFRKNAEELYARIANMLLDPPEAEE